MLRTMDLHCNIFYSYRGQSTDEADRDRQIENNLTKALINTLDLGGIAVYAPFLREIGVPDATDVRFLLQRKDLPSGTSVKKRSCILLGIAKHKQESNWGDEVANGTLESVPDAWVYGDGFAVLVECKVGEGKFSHNQMQAHIARLRSLGGVRPNKVLKTWAEIHGIFTRVLRSLRNAPSAMLLVEQFIQFLEFSGMSEFNGFRLDHFHYFLLHDDDDARRWIREQMGYVAVRVKSLLHEFDKFYEDYDLGNLKRTDLSCWVAFGPRDGKYRKTTHQTMSLGSDGLRVFVNIELKEATNRLKKVLEQSNATFRLALQQLNAFKPFEIVLQERVQHQASLYDYTPKMQLHSSLLDEATGDAAWTAFTQTIDRLPLPYLRLERLIPGQKLIELSNSGDPDQVVRHVFEILRHNHAVVKLLNE